MCLRMLSVHLSADLRAVEHLLHRGKRRLHGQLREQSFWGSEDVRQRSSLHGDVSMSGEMRCA